MRSTYSPSQIFTRPQLEYLAAPMLMHIYLGEKARTLCADANQHDCDPNRGYPAPSNHSYSRQ